VALLGLWILAFLVSERFPNESRGNLIASVYSFMLFLLAGVACLCSLIATWNGVRWRPSERDPRSDDPAV
jgi:hypothetical protein